ncbi:MAG: 30S ribosomal protein S9 [Actinomycetota bacterium]
MTEATAELSRATGRRKESVARVRLFPGEGRFVINRGRSLEDYFPNLATRMVILEPLRTLDLQRAYDVFARIEGGGLSGQAGALRHAVSRALVAIDPELRPALKRAGFLRRDPRAKERRKYGLKKARKAPQYSKR